MDRLSPKSTDQPSGYDQKRPSIISKILAAEAKHAANPSLRKNKSIIRSLGSFGNGPGLEDRNGVEGIDSELLKEISEDNIDEQLVFDEINQLSEDYDLHAVTWRQRMMHFLHLVPVELFMFFLVILDVFVILAVIVLDIAIIEEQLLLVNMKGTELLKYFNSTSEINRDIFNASTIDGAYKIMINSGAVQSLAPANFTNGDTEDVLLDPDAILDRSRRAATEPNPTLYDYGREESYRKAKIIHNLTVADAVIHYLSIAILSVFVLEVILKLIGYGKNYFTKKLEVSKSTIPASLNYKDYRARLNSNADNNCDMCINKSYKQTMVGGKDEALSVAPCQPTITYRLASIAILHACAPVVTFLRIETGNLLVDGIVIIISFALDIAVTDITFSSEVSKPILVVFLIWRVIRILNAIALTSRARTMFRLRVLRKSKTLTDAKNSALTEEIMELQDKLKRMTTLARKYGATEPEIDSVSLIDDSISVSNKSATTPKSKLKNLMNQIVKKGKTRESRFRRFVQRRPSLVGDDYICHECKKPSPQAPRLSVPDCGPMRQRASSDAGDVYSCRPIGKKREQMDQKRRRHQSAQSASTSMYDSMEDILANDVFGSESDRPQTSEAPVFSLHVTSSSPVAQTPVLKHSISEESLSEKHSHDDHGESTWRDMVVALPGSDAGHSNTGYLETENEAIEAAFNHTSDNQPEQGSLQNAPQEVTQSVHVQEEQTPTNSNVVIVIDDCDCPLDEDGNHNIVVGPQDPSNV